MIFRLIPESEMGDTVSCLYIPSTDGCSDEGLYAVSIDDGWESLADYLNGVAQVERISGAHIRDRMGGMNVS